MQGQRNDKLYTRITLYIKQNQPVYATELHKFLEQEFNMMLTSSRSRLIRRLMALNLIARKGNPPFCTYKIKIRN